MESLFQQAAKKIGTIKAENGSHNIMAPKFLAACNGCSDFRGFLAGSALTSHDGGVS
jgi:hypothetical protein